MKMSQTISKISGHVRMTTNNDRHFIRHGQRTREVRTRTMLSHEILRTSSVYNTEVT